MPMLSLIGTVTHVVQRSYHQAGVVPICFLLRVQLSSFRLYSIMLSVKSLTGLLPHKQHKKGQHE